MEEQRIDKWLWCVRLFKTRSMATEACRAGKVKMNGVPVKPSHDAKPGQVYDISINQNSRVAAKLVPDYLVDLTPEEEYERIQMVRQYGFEKRDRGAGRPTKRERRDIEEFKYK